MTSRLGDDITVALLSRDLIEERGVDHVPIATWTLDTAQQSSAHDAVVSALERHGHFQDREAVMRHVRAAPRGTTVTLLRCGALFQAADDAPPDVNHPAHADVRELTSLGAYLRVLYLPSRMRDVTLTLNGQVVEPLDFAAQYLQNAGATDYKEVRV